jgi:hypothetical protein
MPISGPPGRRHLSFRRWAQRPDGRDGDAVMVIPAAPGTYLPIEIVGSSARK